MAVLAGTVEDESFCGDDDDDVALLLSAVTAANGSMVGKGVAGVRMSSAVRAIGTVDVAVPSEMAPKSFRFLVSMFSGTRMSTTSCTYFFRFLSLGRWFWLGAVTVAVAAVVVVELEGTFVACCCCCCGCSAVV